jgi:hypothetical protein
MIDNTVINLDNNKLVRLTIDGIDELNGFKYIEDFKLKLKLDIHNELDLEQSINNTIMLKKTLYLILAKLCAIHN